MNLSALAPQWAVFALLALLAAAALQDAVQLRISNFLCLAVLVVGLVAIGFAGPEVALWQNATVFLVTLVVGTLLFDRGALGGGDVKLLAATSLWFDFEGALRLLICVTLAGGVLALFILGLRMVRWSAPVRQRVAILRPKGGIPYGVAIAAGAAMAVALSQPARPPSPPALPGLPVLPN